MEAWKGRPLAPTMPFTWSGAGMLQAGVSQSCANSSSHDLGSRIHSSEDPISHFYNGGSGWKQTEYVVNSANKSFPLVS